MKRRAGRTRRLRALQHGGHWKRSRGKHNRMTVLTARPRTTGVRPNLLRHRGVKYKLSQGRDRVYDFQR